MRVVVDVRPLLASEETGVGLFTRELTNTLIAQAPHIDWVLFSNAAQTDAPLVSSAPSVTIAHSRYPNIFFNALCASRAVPLDYIVRRQVGPIDWWFSPNLHFTPLGRKTKQTLLMHDATCLSNPYWFTLRQRFKHALAKPRTQCQRAAHVIVPSESTKNDLVRFIGIDSTKIIVAAPGVPTAALDFAAQSSAQQDSSIDLVRKKYNIVDRFILYVGSLEPRKNVTTLIDTFKALQNNMLSGYSLVILGAHGWSNASVYRAFNGASSATIKYLGYTSAEEKTALVSAASAVVYPSLYEGFGFPVLEALALGKPVITSPRASIPALAGGAALYAHPERPDELARALFAFKNDERLTTKKIALGLERAQQFSWQRVANTLLNLWTR